MWPETAGVEEGRAAPREAQDPRGGRPLAPREDRPGEGEIEGAPFGEGGREEPALLHHRGLLGLQELSLVDGEIRDSGGGKKHQEHVEGEKAYPEPGEESPEGERGVSLPGIDSQVRIPCRWRRIRGRFGRTSSGAVSRSYRWCARWRRRRSGH